MHSLDRIIFALVFFCCVAVAALSLAADDQEALNKLQALRKEIDQKKNQENTFSSKIKELLRKKQSVASGEVQPNLMELLNRPKNLTTTSSVVKADENDQADLEEAEAIKREHETQLKRALSERTFQELLAKMMPLTPQQIKRLREHQEQIDIASKGVIGIPPKPVAISHFVSLAPGDKLPVIRMQQGFVSSLVFIDATGAPWPIELYSLGDTNLFNVSWDKKSNILLIQANHKFNYGNLAVKLVGQNTPVMLTLIPGQREVDYRADLRVQGVGPNALPTQISEGVPSKANDLLLTVLNGVVPVNAKRLRVLGGNAQAWLIQDKVYLRTRMVLISPAWLSSMSSPDGMNVYEIIKTPIILISRRIPNKQGQIISLKLEGM